MKRPKRFALGLFLAVSAVCLLPSNWGLAGKRREYAFSAGSGIALNEVDSANGQHSVQITNTSPGGGGVASVTGSSGVACSPTTGAANCTNTDPGSGVSVVAGSNISSVTRAGNAWTVNAATQAGAIASVNGGTPISCSNPTGPNVTCGSTCASQVPLLGTSCMPGTPGGFVANNSGATIWMGCAGDVSCAFGTPNVTFTVNSPPKTSAVISQQGGSGVGVTFGGFATILTNSVTVASGQVILMHAGIECGSGTIGITQRYDYVFDIDGTGVSTIQSMSVPMVTGTEIAAGAAFFAATGVSAGTHSVTLVARKGINSGTDSCLGSLLTQVVTN